MTRLRTSRRSSGFTLLELLVSLVLLSLVMTTVYSGLRLAGKGVDTGSAISEQVQAMRTTRMVLRRITQQIQPVLVQSSENRRQVYFEGTSTQMRFLARTPAALAVGGLYAMELVVIARGDAPTLVLRQKLFHPDNEGFGPESGLSDETEVLGPNAAITFRFYGALKPRTVATWHQSWQKAQRLPSLIELSVVPAQGPAWPPLVLEIAAVQPIIRVREPVSQSLELAQL